MLQITPAITALLLGFVPALLWLGFWLLEDRRHPEPTRFIQRAFIAGMVAVFLVLPLQKWGLALFPGAMTGDPPFLLLVLWATIEEVMKLAVAVVAVLRTRAVDEPIDIPIYLITVALGFAAVENTFFLFNPGEAGITAALVTGELRAIGATLIHVLCSAYVGRFIAHVFYRGLGAQIFAAIQGLILASLLHAFFNFSILQVSGGHLLTVFSGVWVGIVILLIGLERVKLLHRPAWWEKSFTKKKP